MASFTPSLGTLPDEFPVFPLAGALLLPHGRLPLNIFEPRYCAMIEDALAAGRMFGMIQPDSSQPDGPTGPGLYRVGCLARLVAFSETDDDRFLITLAGLIRFRTVTELETRRGYRRVRADFSSFAQDLQPPEAITDFDRGGLLRALRGYFAHRSFEANWDSINEMPDQDLLVTLCMACPFDPAEQQALLEANGPVERAQTLLALLQIDTHAPIDQSDTPPGRTRAS